MKKEAVNLKGLIPEQLRSYNWKALAQKKDVQNALIGSALGGLILGGSSLAQDRDPEESKLAPVGDALIGALAGGAAGYGIPKGLELFAHPGTGGGQAPGLGEQIRRSALWGGGVGTALAGLSTLKDYVGARGRIVSTLAKRVTPEVITRGLRDKLELARGELDQLAKTPEKLLTLAKKKRMAGLVNHINGLAAKVDALGGSYEDAMKTLNADLNDAVSKLKDAKITGKGVPEAQALVEELKGQLKTMADYNAKATKVKLTDAKRIWDNMKYSPDTREALFQSGKNKWGLGPGARFLANRLRPRGYEGRPGALKARFAKGGIGGAALALLPLLYEQLNKVYEARKAAQ